MKFRIDSLIFGGVQADTGPEQGSTGRHTIVEEQSGAEIATFDNDIEAELYLAAMRTRLESGQLPPLSEAQLKETRGYLDELEKWASRGESEGTIRRWLDNCRESGTDRRILDAALRARIDALRKRIDSA